MKILTFFNNKGGVGKTTTVVNLASYLKKHFNKNVLLVDLDPQSNSTQLIVPEENWEDFYSETATRATIMSYFGDMDEGNISLENIEIPIKSQENKYNLDMIPGHPNLSIIDDKLSRSWNNMFAKEKGDLRIVNWLNQLRGMFSDYDYIFIDVGPSLGALNRSILLNTDYFLAPMGSDIFSVIGVGNIESWIKRWRSDYETAISTFMSGYGADSIKEFAQKYAVNLSINDTTKFIGYSVQQYSKRKFKGKVRPVQAYENVISKMDDKIYNSLGNLLPESVKRENMKIGDVPYVYSIVPLSQTANCPIFDLDYQSGLRGNQSSSVEEYTKYLDEIATNLLKNLGDLNGD
ncbi:ParA family protein (plasmid) [Bacillus thuringiensis serovar sumiyoshiensis]|uniref:ParA family protein n=1 Tax=Bacillus thuringiensis TaxID=1428 RepID=UPI000A3BB1BE|nr:ParA family protein [Bacillus thuringiensis]OTW83840.1 cobalamin biosynthesis protein CobQ [Bacillus thuringiensis serovar sumiyoshiensis]